MLLSCVWARSVSNAVPRPPSRRSRVSSQGAALVLAIALGDGQQLLGSAQLEVRPRDLRRERHSHVAQVLFRRADQRALGLHSAADPAEHIHLPERVEPRVPDVLVGEAPAAAHGKLALAIRCRV